MKHHTYNINFAIAAWEEGFEVWLADIESENDVLLNSLAAIHDAEGHMFMIKEETK